MMHVQTKSSSDIVRQIRSRWESASKDWMFDAETTSIKLTAVDHGTSDPQPVCTFQSGHNPADVEFLASAHADIASLLQLVKNAEEIIRSHSQSAAKAASDATKRKSTPAQQAAMAAQHVSFQNYLAQVGP